MYLRNAPQINQMTLKMITQMTLMNLMIMAIGVVEFSREGYKIRKVFA